jgi:PKD repeat protein
MGGSYNAVRPDIYLDPSTQRLHVVASSFDDAKYVYYRTSADGGQHWDPVRNVDFINNTRYASVYAYGDNVYIASRTMEDGFLAPIFRVVTMRSLNGGTTWQDRTLLAEHSALTSSEYGLSLTGFEGTMFMLYENNQKIIFNKSTNGAYWDQVILYSQGEGKWPTITASPDGRAWASWLNASGVVEMREYLGGSLQSIGSYGPVEALYAATYPNFKEGTNFGKVEWVTTSCNAAPFAISLDSKTAGVNTPPYAFFDAPADAQAGSPVLFDAAASYDMDGDSLVYNWDFGDGNTGTGAAPSHTYTSAGDYTVSLTVDDGSGGSDTTSAQVEVTAAPNNPPTADIGGAYSGAEGVPISFDGSQSSDPDGDLLTFSWDFGDGNTDTGAAPSHTYTSAGDYTVSLTVDDGNGGSDTASAQVEVTAAPNNPPTADIGGPYSGAEGVPISFDGSQSSDPDGDFLTFSWDFGDGNTGTGAAPSHTYTSAGDYTVSLTVDDGNGGSDTATTTASISAVAQSSIHIGDLDASRTPIRNKWVAIVIIQVHDDQHNPVEQATVSGMWSDGVSGTDSCMTDASGLCTITTSEILKKVPSSTFTVNDISHATLSYDGALNHDPEADSDGTSIIVYLDPVTEPTPTPEPSPTPPPSGDSSLHIADLEGTGTPVRSKWEAVVEILVHDQDETPLAGVTVTGTWSADGEASCVTGAFGTCTVTKNNLKMDVSPVTFTITDAALSGYTYAFDENHDLDDDTDGTTIVIDAPPPN